ncbi:MAG: hypothetical protein VKJ46_13525 [Leptolyngbyaceae bacterium]|nr:hypothetical protein [Leptolyngbyaceae bacterium]
MSDSQTWYIIKQPDGHCEISPTPQAKLEQWGPFDSQGEAIARRVGLIRAGKCQPV